MKNKTIFAVLLILAVGCSSTVGQAPQVSIPIVNGDFENVTFTSPGPVNDPAGCGTGQNFDSVPGWNFVHLAPGSGGGVVHWTCDNGLPPSNMADLCCGEGMWQLTGERARQGSYRPAVDIANWFYVYPGDWKVELFQVAIVTSCPTGGRCLFDYTSNQLVLFSPAPFCSASGWNVGDARRKTIPCEMPGYFLNGGSDPLTVGGQNGGGLIAIFFTNGIPNPALGGHAEWPILIDNVTLSFTPAS